METYSQFIHLSRYSRYLDEKQRRESWDETVDRVMKFWTDRIDNNVLTTDEATSMRNQIFNMDVMPSMRAMWSAGDALDKNHFRGYNCSFAEVNHIRVFDEILYILMAGTGVGFSCENKHTSKLPIINDVFNTTERVIPVEDSAEGWAKGLRKLIAELYLGNLHKWDYSAIRPEGARLKTMGGRASGPQPLVDLFEFVTRMFKANAGRKLTSLQVHDIICKIAEVVVVGGVRRSALISLSDLNDPEVRDAKSGTWWETEGQRSLANNSAVYDQKPSMTVFMDEWVSLMKSGSGERGIFSRYGAQKQNNNGRRDASLISGSNPCAEILLRGNQLCNLTEVVCRSDDTLETLLAKVQTATILGTLQSTLTDFKYVRKIWQKNCEEERLLGVSLTGIQDCKLLNQHPEETLIAMREHAVEVNAHWSEMLGINPSAAITTVKPSGTVSQLVDSSSGIHGRFSPYYIRTVRQANNDPMTTFLKDAGVPYEADIMNPTKTTIFSFPIKSPVGAIMADEQSALKQLKNWKVFQDHWSEHSVSVTIYVKDDEWLQVGAWVYDNFDSVTGISFLPYSEHTYQQAPYQDISEKEYVEAVKNFPKEVDFTQLVKYEGGEDHTEGAQTLACAAGGCEI